ncbi:MAG TPA: AAA family ATPase, partial [Candidatus Limnocylindria bacterium]|nr:AAA family ATPase [Candidatus Limnocylindria bacterium]
RATCALFRDELGLTVGAELRGLEQMILRHDAQLESGAAVRARDEAVLCPFKGLAAFESSDAEFFCGRDRTVSELVARLAEWPLVGILGPSGIGKSSLLRAGILPALRRGVLPDSSRWRQVLLRPGEHPVEELRHALGGDLADMIDELEHGGRLVLAVDQLEELFTVCSREMERCEFLARLLEAAADHERRVLVVCVLRADFYGRLSAYPEFAELLSRSHALVGPMARDELREVIERPAARAGLDVERTLVDALVDDVGEEPGGLPLLSTTLLELWQAREGRTLRLAHYRVTGGVRGAVARIGEAAFTNLSTHEQDVARNLLLRLADVGDGAPTRRRLSLVEIARIEGADRVVGKFVEARLLTVGAGTVELSHESLLSEWPRYRGWLDEDRVGRRLHAHLRVAASEWAARGRDPGELYRGARLAAALDFQTEHPQRLDRLEREFVTASRVAADREARRQRAQNRRLRALLLGASVLLILTVAASVVAIVGQHQASIDARLAVSEEQAALGRQLGAEALGESRLDAAALMARAAVALDRSALTEGTLLSVLLRSPAVLATLSLRSDAAPEVAVSPDGRTLAVSDTTAGQLRLYDAERYKPAGQILGDFRGDQPPAYSGDGSLLVYPSGASLVVRDARTLALRAQLPIPSPFSQELTSDIPNGSIAVSPGDDAVYYAYWLVDSTGRPTDAYLSRWSLPSGRPLSTIGLGSGPVLGFRIVDHGAEVIVVSAHDVATYDARTGRVTQTVAIHPAPPLPSAAAISPDGGRIVIGSETGSVWFVATSSGSAERAAAGHAGPVASVVYEPGGARAVTVGEDGRVIVWNVESRTPLVTLSGSAERVRGAAV